MIKDALSIYAAERHPFQVQTVDMAAKTIADMKRKLEEDIVATQAKVDGADVEKASRTDAATASAAKLTELEQAGKRAREAVDADKAADAEAKLSLTAAGAAITSTAADLESAEKKKSKLETVRKDVYEPLKTSKATGLQGHRDLKNLVNVIKECGCEAALADSLAETFTKDVDARATFDDIVIKELDAQMTSRIAEFESAIKDGESTKQKASDTKAAAEDKVKVSSEKLATSKATLADAEAALSDGRKALQSAKAAVENYDKDMKAAATSLAKAKEALTSFLDGPLKAFQELKDLAPPAPEPEPQAASEEAPAAAPEA